MCLECLSAQIPLGHSAINVGAKYSSASPTSIRLEAKGFKLK